MARHALPDLFGHNVVQEDQILLGDAHQQLIVYMKGGCFLGCRQQDGNPPISVVLFTRKRPRLPDPGHPDIVRFAQKYSSASIFVGVLSMHSIGMTRWKHPDLCNHQALGLSCNTIPDIDIMHVRRAFECAAIRRAFFQLYKLTYIRAMPARPGPKQVSSVADRDNGEETGIRLHCRTYSLI